MTRDEAIEEIRSILWIRLPQTRGTVTNAERRDIAEWIIDNVTTK